MQVLWYTLEHQVETSRLRGHIANVCLATATPIRQKFQATLNLQEESENDTNGFDVLVWWEGKLEKFPVLSAMGLWLEIFLRFPLVLCHLNLPLVVGEGFWGP